MNTRKALSLALALALTLGLAAPAMAAGKPDIPMPKTDNLIFTSEELIRTDKDDLGNDILVYPEGTVFLHDDFSATDSWHEKDNKDGAKGNTGYGSSFQLPKTGVVFEVSFQSFTEKTYLKYIMLEGDSEPAETAEPAPSEPVSAEPAGKPSSYTFGFAFEVEADKACLGETRDGPNEGEPVYQIPVGTTIIAPYGTMVTSLYDGATKERIEGEAADAILVDCYDGAELSDFGYASVTIKTEGYFNIMTDMIGETMMVKGVNTTAYPSTQGINVDGVVKEFQMYALKDANGNLTNYVKAQDIASALNGTTAQFNVAQDKAVNLIPGERYAADASKTQPSISGEQNYTKPAAVTNISGVAAELDAIVLTDSQGNTSTYYRLRDLGKALGFNVGWSSDKGVFVETSNPYTDND